MHYSIQNLIIIKKEINSKLNKVESNNTPKIIAVSKTFSLDKILPLIEYGHQDFGENKVQESIEKWSIEKQKNKNIRLHLIGKLQRNKVKSAVEIFDYIHSVDNKKLAKKISEEQIKQNKNVKIFMQVNVGNENQKSGIDIENLEDLYAYCKEIKLDIMGLMCIPPISNNPEKYFSKLKLLKDKFKLENLSMGMSGDYLKAINYSATHLRIGTGIFGLRS
jgi:pyridoxal phosphate enzyme (YggS family)